MDWTDRHCRYFLRLIAPRALLYTEMIPTGAILLGQPERLLRFDRAEHPLALQLGGADPDQLGRCAAAGAARGYDEINLNVGCPSDRVQIARFGACLMAEPELVAACVRAMRAAATVPVTVKTRVGIDEEDSYDFLRRFVEAIAGAGCSHRHSARAQRLVVRAQPQGEPRDPAAALRAGVSRQGRFPRARDHREWRHPLARAGAHAARQGRRRDDRPRGVPESLRSGRVGAARSWAAAQRRHRPGSRWSSACCRTSSGSWPKAHRCARSPGMCSGCSTACPARAPGAAACPKRRTAPAPARSCSSMRWMRFGSRRHAAMHRARSRRDSGEGRRAAPTP